MKFHEQNLIGWSKSMVRRLNLGQLLVAICIVALSIWCAINVQHIFIKFSQHDTIISLENNPPIQTPFPGITICAPSIFKPQQLAKLFPDFEAKLKSYEEWRRYADVPNKESDDINGQKNRYQDLLIYEAKAMKNLSATEIIHKFSVQKDDLLENCEFHPMNIRNFQLFQGDDGLRPKARKCADIVPLLESIYEGKKCFTYFSDLHHDDRASDGQAQPPKTTLQRQPISVNAVKDISEKLYQNTSNNNDSNQNSHYSANVTQVDLDNCESNNSCKKTNVKMSDVFHNSNTTMVFDLNPSIEIRVKAIENDIWNSYVNDPILMTVHPPNILQNRRDFLFFQVMRNNFYEIAFTKKTTYLLPPPYKTRCIVYLNDAEFHKYITRDSCITNCILNQVSSSFCANYYGVLIEEMFTSNSKYTRQHICPHNNQNYSAYLEARNKCEQHCPAECTKTLFEISGQVRNPYEDSCSKWWDGESDGDNDIGDMADGGDSNYALESEDRVNVGDTKVDTLKLARTTTYLSLHRWGHTIPTVPAPNDRPKDSYYSSDGALPSICQSARVSIRISPKPFTTVRHQAAITWEGFLGTVGGHIGIWLGLSLYKIIKFAVHILYNLLHKLVRSTSNRCGPTID